MNYAEAAKQVRSVKKQADSYLVFRFSYGERFILPHKDGLNLLQAMSAAEQIPSYFPSDKPPEIKQAGSGAVSVEAMSQKEYENIKIAALLGVSIQDLEAAQKQELT